jgi:hypothetical protein
MLYVNTYEGSVKSKGEQLLPGFSLNPMKHVHD